MPIRSFTPNDFNELREIHTRHFEKEFTLPDFLNYICVFVVEDEQEKTVTIGGIRSIAECVAVTDLDRDPRVRIRALHQLLDAATFVCRRSGFDQMYAWSQNPRWTRRMTRTGFRLPEGQSLILDL